jgi:hypothetical protein
MNWFQPKGGGTGSLVIRYKHRSSVITIGEGNFCTSAANPDSYYTDPSACWDTMGDLGSANFGDLTALLHTRTAVPQWTGSAVMTGTGTVYAAYVNAGTTLGYQIVGQGMSESSFKTIAAAMVKMPRS